MEHFYLMLCTEVVFLVHISLSFSLSFSRLYLSLCLGKEFRTERTVNCYRLRVLIECNVDFYLDKRTVSLEKQMVKFYLELLR